MNLGHLTQAVRIWPEEARVLQEAIDAHLAYLNLRTTKGGLQLLETLSLKPLGRVHQQLTRMLTGQWPKYGARRLYQKKQRIWRIGFDELLLLNRLYLEGTLQKYIEGQPRVDLFRIGGEMNQKAQNLNQYFAL